MPLVLHSPAVSPVLNVLLLLLEAEVHPSFAQEDGK